MWAMALTGEKTAQGKRQCSLFARGPDFRNNFASRSTLSIVKPMKWILVERKPDVVYPAGEEIYLGADDKEVSDVRLAMTFATRQEAEAHRRSLKHRYDWVAATAPD
jgi:hypothetical protein